MSTSIISSASVVADMSIVRQASLIMVVLCVLITVGSGAVAGQEITEPDSWGSDVIDVDSDPPGDLDKAYINYNDTDEVLQFRVNFSTPPDDPMSDNITQIYIDSDTDASTGLNSTTYSDGGSAETFYNNTDGIGADYRVSIGDDTNIVSPWDDSTDQFVGTEGESIAVKQRTESVVAEVPLSAIGSPEELDLKFAYLDRSDGVEGTDDYTWAPDPNDDSEESVRFSTLDGGNTIQQATVEATVNINNAPVADDTAVEFTLSDGTTRTVDHDSNSDITETFTVDSSEFNGDEEITAVIAGGENYTLDSTKNITTITGEGDSESETFNPHEFITVSGDVTGLSNKEGSVSIEVQDDEGNQVGPTDEITFDGTSSSESYTLSGLNATEFSTDDGEVVASLDADPNELADSRLNLGTSRDDPNDKTKGFTVTPPGQVLNLTTNISDADITSDTGFNLTVNASASNGRIDSINHVIEYNPDQVTVIKNESLISNSYPFDPDPLEPGSYEMFHASGTGSAVVPDGEEKELYNLTFKFNEDLDPAKGDNVGITVNTETAGTEMINSSKTDSEKYLEFGSNPGDLTVVNSETEITIDEVDHLTSGGVMIGAPTKFSVEASTVGDGEVKKIVLRNSRTGTVNDTYSCTETPCIADLSDETGPAEDTFAGNATADYLPRNIYNIEAAPDGPGNNKTESESVEVYKKGDVNHNDDDAGNVTLNDVNSMLDARGQEAAGGLPWEQNRQARYDVNNDGEIDIVDVTIVVEEYSP